jgi:hypothetical protein
MTRLNIASLKEKRCHTRVFDACPRVLGMLLAIVFGSVGADTMN